MQAKKSKKGMAVFVTFLVAAVAVLLGSSSYTFFYAKGYSYLSDNSSACVNCHVMREHYNAWEVSSHRFVSCNECHLPQGNTVAKYFVKAKNGLNHSYAFTFEDVQIIRATPSNRAVVEQNCVRCHHTMVSQIFVAAKDNRCLTCHRNVGHSF